MRYEYEYHDRTGIHKSARIYPESQKELCMQHARNHYGKVICRETGKVIADFCKSIKEI